MGGGRSKSFNLEKADWNGPLDTSRHLANGVKGQHDSEQNGPTAPVTPALQNGHAHVRERQLSGGFIRAKPGDPLEGPDEVVPATDYWTCDPEQPVKLNMSDDGPWSAAPVSVVSIFTERARKFPDHCAMVVKRDERLIKWTYHEYYIDARKAAKSLIKLGLEPAHGVAIIGFNSPEWFIADMGAILAGGLAAGIYTTNSPDACQYVANDCKANVIVVENDQQLQKILSVRDQLPHLKAIVQYIGDVKVKDPNIYNWKQFMELAHDVPEAVLDERIRMQAPNKCCLLIYTSGTTGTPKGVMLSHDNIMWTASMCTRTFFGEDYRLCSHSVVSYLPLSHVAAQMIDMMFPIFVAGTTFFARPDALKGTLVDTLREARPTLFLGVPRVFEKMQEKMMAVGRTMSDLQRRVAGWAKDIGLRGNMALMKGESVPWGWTLANALIFKKIARNLGLDRCEALLVGAAPIPRETLEYFMSINLPLMELYGMSECSGPETVSKPDSYLIGSVGKVIVGGKIKLANCDAENNGEICMGGRHVFMGYLSNPEKTKEAIDDEGWLHSGDVGKLNEDGFLFITGRIKELIITAGGENVAPVPIEDNVKEQLPILSNVMLIGDRRKFLSMLMTLKVNVNEDTGEPTDDLAAVTLDWLKALGCTATKVTELVNSKDERVYKAIQEGVKRANLKSVSNAQKVQKWTVLPADFSIHGGELGPTLKLKRSFVDQKYTDVIEALYSE
ncbi:PREDICTED: long-chain-fatty-acid--CoA ligase ACSBG2-like isoform X2 [Priapulus caudatus]|uniref:long-chain-fatty-acid--CoA ligase n=1 Tax=Priapulus caudatus TaxID=37621 RepID=A0ABM1ET97_PRICU|nr:PREDICTED: long-chain-fatty-acid--CoA ligase ACSBG2-like isoform X2 [Priapulus caudatus]